MISRATEEETIWTMGQVRGVVLQEYQFEPRCSDQGDEQDPNVESGDVESGGEEQVDRTLDNYDPDACPRKKGNRMSHIRMHQYCDVNTQLSE